MHNKVYLYAKIAYFCYNFSIKTKKLYDKYCVKNIKAFSQKLIPNLDYPVYGIQVPLIREMAEEIEDLDFKIRYHEDVLLRGFIIAKRKTPVEEKLALITTHLPLLSTWDETDTFASSLKFRKKEIDKAYEYFYSLLSDERTFVRRIAVVWIMGNRKKVSAPLKEQLDGISKVRNDDYYIAMAVAWALSSYYITDRELTKPYIDKADDVIKKMTMLKIRDSRR